MKQRTCKGCLCYDEDKALCEAHNKNMKPDGYCIFNGLHPAILVN